MLDNVTEDMLIYREETFGPVAGVTVFDTEDEAIRMANDTIYGLAAYFHTRDYARLLRVAERLEYGIVGANDGIISSAAAPFGGIKESGYGREGGPQGIDEYLDVKYVSIGGVGSPLGTALRPKRQRRPPLHESRAPHPRREREGEELALARASQLAGAWLSSGRTHRRRRAASSDRRKSAESALEKPPLRRAGGVGRGGLLRLPRNRGRGHAGQRDARDGPRA